MKRTDSFRLFIILLMLAFVVAGVFIPLRSIKGIKHITGKVATTVVIYQYFTDICVVNLYSGWNLVAFPCIVKNESIENILSNVAGSVVSVHTYNASDELDHWKAYNPNLPAWVVQDLAEVSRLNGYWVKATSQGQIMMLGNLTSPTPIRLKSGWNLVAYPSKDKALVNESVSSLPCLEEVWAYNATDASDHWKMYSPALSPDLNDLQYFLPSTGYWMYLEQEDRWIVD